MKWLDSKIKRLRALKRNPDYDHGWSEKSSIFTPKQRHTSDKSVTIAGPKFHVKIEEDVSTVAIFSVALCLSACVEASVCVSKDICE